MVRIGSVIMSASLIATLVAPLQAATPPAPPGGKVFIFSCAVMFATKSSGTSSTRPGFGESRATRNEATVSREFNIAGYDSTSFQRITDAICDGAPAELTAAGYEVVTEGVMDHYAYRRAVSSGQDSPQRQGANGTSYLVFSRSGLRIVDAAIVGGMGAASIGFGEATLGKMFAANAVSLLYSVDFASIDAAETRRGAGQNTASVTTSLQVSVGLSVTSTDASRAKCFKGSPFGEFKNLEFCNLRSSNDQITYALPSEQERSTRDPIVSVEDVTGATGVAMAGVNAAMSILSMGRGGGGSVDFKRFSVTVDPTKYEAVAVESARGLIAPAMKWIYEPDSRPRRGRR